MDISLRTQEIGRLFSYEKRAELPESGLEIIPYRFVQVAGAVEINEFQKELAPAGFCSVPDNSIAENQSFVYTIFAPRGKEKRDKTILLLHGLNERSWDKYWTWAEYLAKETGKPVILFPIAFHMNRTPSQWWNPRITLAWANRRKQEIADVSNSTFANVAISSRLSVHPLRFYASGRESVYNIRQLVSEIKEGRHPLFKEGTSVHIFGYSIGALLAQILLLANPGNLFGESRLFMFCGGSIFNEMNGNARDILDKEAYDRLRQYYTGDFLQPHALSSSFKKDRLERAFKAMIRPDILQDYRESFFRKACQRIRGISLKKDVVMPTEGIRKAFGKISGKIMEEMDFPFPYSHQLPFPLRPSPKETPAVNGMFLRVFGKAAAFLG